MNNTNYWALLANFNIPTTYKINRTWWSLESHGSHTVNGVQLIPGAPGFNPKYAYMMWDALFNVPAVQAATPLTLTGNNGNDTLTGGTENDTFTGGAGADSLSGGDGNDTFNVTTTADDGNDTINGGAGTDTIAVAAGQTIVFAANNANITLVENITLGAGASVTLTGQTEGFTITGGTGNETVVGGSGNDTITGGAGADSINAGAGTNTITDAGQGADTITHNAAASTVAIAVTGTGTVTLAASQDGATANSNAGVNTAINASTSTAAVTLNGNTGNDSLTGGSGADTLSGGAGNDTISAGAGADSITGGGGADTIDVGNNDAAVDTVVLAAAADSYVGAITSGTTNLSASIDVVSNLAVDDRFDLTALGLNTSVNGAAVTSNLAAVTTAGSWGLIRGTYVAGVFTQNTGTDTHTLLVYDADGAGADTNLGAVVLVGLFGASAVNGMVTLSVPLGFNITGTAGNDNLIGTAFADTIAGVDGNDTITAGDGNDTITGGAGADSLSGGDGNDTFNVTADDGNDTINGGAGTDTIAVAAGQTIVFATNDANITGVENITLGAGASVTLTGQTEAFTITGSTGNETVVGGSGNDRFNFVSTEQLNQAALVSGGLGLDSVAITTGTSDINLEDSDFARTSEMEGLMINRSAGSHVLRLGAATNAAFTTRLDLTIQTGGSLVDFQGSALIRPVNFTTADPLSTFIVETGSGNDILRTGNNQDRLSGGGGNDMFFVTNTAKDGNDTINGGAGTDTIVVIAGQTIVFAANDANITGVENITLNVGASVTLTGQTEGFTITGDTGNETVVGGSGNDTITGGAGADSLSGGDGNDTFNVTITANDGNDTINGGAGTDTIVVIAGQTIVFAANDANITGVENITLNVGASVTLTGQTEGFNIIGATSFGNESIVGSSGNDTITAGEGNDTIAGGSGVDRFVFANSASNNGLDTITDFVAGAAGDILDFEAFLSGPSTGVFNALSGGVYSSLAAAKTGVLDSNKLSVNAIANKIIILKGVLTDYDTAEEIADLFDTATDNNGTLSGALNISPKAVLIIGADNGTSFNVAFVSNAETAGIQDSEVKIVGTFTGSTADAVDLFALSNFFLA